MIKISWLLSMCSYCVKLFTCFSEDSEWVSTSDSSDSSENAGLFSSETSREEIMLIRIKSKGYFWHVPRGSVPLFNLTSRVHTNFGCEPDYVITYYAFLKKDIKNNKKDVKQ